MSYNPYNAMTPARPIRVVLGFALVALSLSGGMMFGAHDLHKAMVMQGEPVEMDWQTLVDEGYGDNPHIRLVDVSIVDPYSDIDEVFEDADLEELMADPGFRYYTQIQRFSSAKIIPAGADEDTIPEKIIVAPGNQFLDRAFEQVDETGELAGMVTTYTADDMLRDFVGYCMGREIDDVDPDEELEEVYTLFPADEAPNLEHAKSLFIMSGFGLALGLIIMGSGGPNFYLCWFFPLPCALSMIGYPMRYGRGKLGTRMLYATVGAALMGYGYYLLVPMGNFGSADGNPIFHSLGFACLFIGLGAALAVPVQITCRALAASVEAPSGKKPVRMSWAKACSMDPVEKELSYEDDELAPAGMLPLSGDLKGKAEALQECGFNKADALHWHREIGMAAAAIQVGCQKMVVTDMEYNNEADIVETGLISILGTGLPIITVSANSSFKPTRPTTNSLIQRSTTSNPTEMLSAHLELVINEAEKRDTVVVEINESEIQNVVMLARRAIAEVQATKEGVIMNVGPKRYGRFAFPQQPVVEIAAPAKAEALS